jgi:hypothetical protein
MRTTLISLVLLASAVAPGVAAADATSERAAAVQLCRNQVADQAGVSVDNVRLTGLQETLRQVRVSVGLWRDGSRQTVRCDVSRGENQSVVAINPPIQTASAH